MTTLAMLLAPILWTQTCLPLKSEQYQTKITKKYQFHTDSQESKEKSAATLFLYQHFYFLRQFDIFC